MLSVVGDKSFKYLMQQMKHLIKTGAQAGKYFRRWHKIQRIKITLIFLTVNSLLLYRFFVQICTQQRNVFISILFPKKCELAAKVRSFIEAVKSNWKSCNPTELSCKAPPVKVHRNIVSEWGQHHFFLTKGPSCFGLDMLSKHLS